MMSYLKHQETEGRMLEPLKDGRITAGSLRAGQNISARFRKALPELPESNYLTLAQIVDAETGASLMLEALKGIKAALGQNRTFPADVDYARKIADRVIQEIDGLPKL